MSQHRLSLALPHVIIDAEDELPEPEPHECAHVLAAGCGFGGL